MTKRTMRRLNPTKARKPKVAAAPRMKLVKRMADFWTSEDGTYLLNERRQVTMKRHSRRPNPTKRGTPRPPAGTPTATNLYALATVFGDQTEIPNKLDAVHLPHLRRCMAAGLLVADRTSLRLTPAGVSAVLRHRAEHPWMERVGPGLVRRENPGRRRRRRRCTSPRPRGCRGA